MPTYEKLREQLPVLIETVEEGLMPCDGGRDSWEFARKAKKGAKQIIAPRADNQPLDAYFLQEEHHHDVDGLFNGKQARRADLGGFILRLASDWA